MKSFPIHIKPFGENAALLEWPNLVSDEILDDILSFVSYLKAKIAPHWETIIAYNSLLLVNNKESILLGEIEDFVKDYSENRQSVNFEKENHLWEIPVCYDKEFGLDLDAVSKQLGLSIEEIIKAHTAQAYRVYGIGFLPGFMYLGGLPKHLELPRLSEPRLKVAKGSVGLAGKQTGIYPQTSPGGWNIIGNCPISLFDPKKEDPCFIRVGDMVQFFPIERATYDLKKIEAEVGIYKPKRTVLND